MDSWLLGLALPGAVQHPAGSGVRGGHGTGKVPDEVPDPHR